RFSDSIKGIDPQTPIPALNTPPPPLSPRSLLLFLFPPSPPLLFFFLPSPSSSLPFFFLPSSFLPSSSPPPSPFLLPPLP
ncbi:hypothetical protein ACXWR7_12720, partial [Streptococcus pyogenes]